MILRCAVPKTSSGRQRQERIRPQATQPRRHTEGRLRKGIAAGILATVATELIAALTGGPTTIFVTPLAPVLGHFTTLAGICVRAAGMGLLFAAIEPHLPGRSAVRKAIALAAFLWLASVAGALAAGVAPGVPDAARLILAIAHGASLGAAWYLLTPERWAREEVPG